MGSLRRAVGEMEHGADFAGGTAGDIQERDQFGGAAAFEAFGDIVGNGQRGAAELVAQIAGLGIEPVARVGVDAPREIERRVSDRQVFEAFVFHGLASGSIRDLRFEI